MVSGEHVELSPGAAAQSYGAGGLRCSCTLVIRGADEARLSRRWNEHVAIGEHRAIADAVAQGAGEPYDVVLHPDGTETQEEPSS